MRKNKKGEGRAAIEYFDARQTQTERMSYFMEFVKEAPDEFLTPVKSQRPSKRIYDGKILGLKNLIAFLNERGFNDRAK